RRRLRHDVPHGAREPHRDAPGGLCRRLQPPPLEPRRGARARQARAGGWPRVDGPRHRRRHRDRRRRARRRGRPARPPGRRGDRRRGARRADRYNRLRSVLPHQRACPSGLLVMNAVNAVLDRIGLMFLGVFEQTGVWFRMLGRTASWTFRRPFEWREWLRQMVRVGTDSIPVVVLTSMFTGMVNIDVSTTTGMG